MKKLFYLFIFLLVSCASTSVDKSINQEYFKIANAYKENKNYENAIKYYELVLKDKDLRVTAWYEIGLCYTYNKKWQEARIIFKRLLKNDRENLNLKLSLAYIEAMCGNLQTAEKMYIALMNENDYDVSIIKNLFAVYIASKKFNEAKATFVTFSEKFPDDSSIDNFKNKLKELAENLEIEDELFKQEETSENENNMASSDTESEDALFNTDDVEPFN